MKHDFFGVGGPDAVYDHEGGTLIGYFADGLAGWVPLAMKDRIPELEACYAAMPSVSRECRGLLTEQGFPTARLDELP